MATHVSNVAAENILAEPRSSHTKCTSWHAHLHLPANIPMEKLSTPYSFHDIARTKLKRSLCQGQRSNEATSWHCTATFIKPISLASVNFLHPSFQDIAWTRFKRSGLLQQGQIKVRLWCCLSTPQPVFPPSMNFLYLTFSEIQPRQDIFHHLPTWPNACKTAYLPSKMPGEKTIPYSLNSCEAKCKLHWGTVADCHKLQMRYHFSQVQTEIVTIPFWGTSIDGRNLGKIIGQKSGHR